MKHRGAGSVRLSTHEMAALMLLGYSTVKLEVEDPDMIALQDAGLARRTEYDPGWKAGMVELMKERAAAHGRRALLN